MHWTLDDLQALDRVPRLTLINSISGIKPANLIGTRSAAGVSNLAIFSSVVHLGSNPPLLGFILRPDQEIRRHTYENLRETGYYTINHVPQSIAEQAHYTSAKFPAEVSEFDACKITEEYRFDFPAPFVGESPIRMGLSYRESIPIEVNNTMMVIGQVEHLEVNDAALETGNHLNLGAADVVGISGLNSYYTLEKLDQFPYARPTAVPDFESKK